MKFIRGIVLAIAMVLILGSTACQRSEKASKEAIAARKLGYVDMTAEEILATLSLEEKAAQMVQAAIYNINTYEMQKYDYGSILSDYTNNPTVSGWKSTVLEYQEAALASDTGIPYLYGTDSVHGVDKSTGTVIFPQNIGIGAANDEELTYQMGLAVADEQKMTGMLWNFAPCVATAADPRWGRTYESYSTDTQLVAKLGVAYSKGLMENGILPCAKHYLGDGMADFGTGEGNYLIDRGDASLNGDEIEAQLAIYQSLIDAGVSSIMLSHSSLNGVKMHENKQYITEILKADMGFGGIVVSDWASIHNITGDNLKDQTITAINAGIDMLMEPDNYSECMQYIIEGVNEGVISRERVDDAVTRILKVKVELELFEDPMQEKLLTNQSEPGSLEYRDIARQLVEKSLVLLKNDNEVLPLKQGSKIYVCGPAADDTGVLCGGWTITWQGAMDGPKQKLITDGTTILEGFEKLAKEHGMTITTDVNEAADADVAILCVGEIPYSEWEGDTEDLSLTGSLGLKGNKKAIDEVKALDIPTIACIVAGRNVLIEDYKEDWDAVVMCYLPGSEGDGVANVLIGKKVFTGKLPMPWYKSTEDIGTGTYQYEIGYGLVTE
ncbi:MAG TPA: glycoside hydrolase family 3 protein [Mobilitalea sp.]|nr:glycoside hydrolase family 3 protein [Mobilitalea sp.]